MQWFALVLVSALVACSTAPIRPLPAANGASGAKLYIEAPTGIPATYDSEIRVAVESDLRSAGVLLLPQAQDDRVRVTIAGDGWSSTDSAIVVSLLLASDPVAQFSFALKELGCFTVFNPTPCISREIAARVLESPALAQAAQHKPAAAGVSSAPPSNAASSPRTPSLQGKLAVLELRNFAKDLTHENAEYFTDLVRNAALKSQPQLQVMTRENLLVLLQSSGKKMEECEGECEVDTGRRIGADLIVSGELQKLGSSYKLSLRMHETQGGRLLASLIASGHSIDELDTEAQKTAEELLATH